MIHDFVYAILFDSGLLKIGYSRNPEHRMRAVQTNSSLQVDERFLFVCEHAQEGERILQRHFRANRISPEWFLLPAEQVKNTFHQDPFTIEGTTFWHSTDDESLCGLCLARKAKK